MRRERGDLLLLFGEPRLANLELRDQLAHLLQQSAAVRKFWVAGLAVFLLELNFYAARHADSWRRVPRVALERLDHVHELEIGQHLPEHRMQLAKLAKGTGQLWAQ